MSPYWNGAATGAIVGWHWGHGREQLFRAVEEGIAYEFRLAMEGVQAATGERIREYVILGGGSNSDLWCQIMADVLGAPVVRAHTAEATNLGAGILGAYGVGWYGSVEEAAAAMTDVAERFEPDARDRQGLRPAVRGGLPAAVPGGAGARSTGSPRSAATATARPRWRCELRPRHGPRRRGDGVRARHARCGRPASRSRSGAPGSTTTCSPRAARIEPAPAHRRAARRAAALYDSDRPRGGARRRRPRGRRGQPRSASSRWRAGRSPPASPARAPSCSRARASRRDADGRVRLLPEALRDLAASRVGRGCRRSSRSAGRARPTRSRRAAGPRRSSAAPTARVAEDAADAHPARTRTAPTSPTTRPASRSARR